MTSFRRVLPWCLLASVVTALIFACPAPAPDDSDDPAAKICRDACDSDSDCEISGHRGACRSGVCSLVVDGPECVVDQDCNFLLSTFSGQDAASCSSSDDCVVPGLGRNPCVRGHSSGQQFCGAPYFAQFCNVAFEAISVDEGVVSLCLEVPAACFEGTCVARTPECTSDTCTCVDESSCTPLFASSTSICAAR